MLDNRAEVDSNKKDGLEQGKAKAIEISIYA